MQETILSIKRERFYTHASYGRQQFFTRVGDWLILSPFVDKFVSYFVDKPFVPASGRVNPVPIFQQIQFLQGDNFLRNLLFLVMTQFVCQMTRFCPWISCLRLWKNLLVVKETKEGSFTFRVRIAIMNKTVQICHWQDSELHLVKTRTKVNLSRDKKKSTFRFSGVNRWVLSHSKLKRKHHGKKGFVTTNSFVNMDIAKLCLFQV